MNLDPTTLEKLRLISVKVRKLNIGVTLSVAARRKNTTAWDLIFGGDDIESAYNYNLIIKYIGKILDKNEIILFPRLVLLNSYRPAVIGIKKAFDLEEDKSFIKNVKLDKILIDEAYLLYSDTGRGRGLGISYGDGEGDDTINKDVTTSASGDVKHIKE